MPRGTRHLALDPSLPVVPDKEGAGGLDSLPPDVVPRILMLVGGAVGNLREASRAWCRPVQDLEQGSPSCLVEFGRASFGIDVAKPAGAPRGWRVVPPAVPSTGVPLFVMQRLCRVTRFSGRCGADEGFFARWHA